MDLRFVTTNPGKLREARAALAPYGVRVEGLPRVLPEPQADRIDDVVRAKLGALPRVAGFQLVEDSGLFVDALRGFPGVYSAYVLRTLGLTGLLHLVPSDRRDATFRTVAGLRHGARSWVFRGAAVGAITKTPRGRNGFGFDPIFVPRGERRTFGQMSTEEKLARSHRGRALRAVGRFLADGGYERTRPREGAGRGSPARGGRAA